MKYFIPAFVMLSMLFNPRAQAQTIPNGGFENWTTVFSTFLQPDHWLASPGARDTPGYVGSYFLNLTNSSTDFAFANTVAFYDYIEDTGRGGFACNSKPACLSGSYRYNITGSDSAAIRVMLYRGYMSAYGGGSYTVCGLGVLYITAGSVSTWTDFSVPITYFPPYDTPDSADILLGASVNQDRANMVAGNYLHIDNLHFCAPSAVNTLGVVKPIEIYPNPVENELFVQGDVPSNATIKIYNCFGQTVFEGKVAQSIDTRTMAAGVYLVNIIGSNSEIIKRAQIVKQ